MLVFCLSLLIAPYICVRVYLRVGLSLYWFFRKLTIGLLARTASYVPQSPTALEAPGSQWDGRAIKFGENFMVTTLIPILTTLLLFGQVQAPTKKLSETDFVSAKECGKCHEKIYSQWSQSMHSKSATDPLYRAVIDEMIRQTGGARKAFCLSCHIPVAGSTGKTWQVSTPINWQTFSEIESEGVTCDFCHTISGKENLGKNISVGAYVYPHQGTTAVKYGRNPDAESSYHRTEVSSFLISAELCAVCHKFQHPVMGTEVQDTYREWLRSPQSRQGVRCQDCHMSAYAGTTASGGKERKEIHAHVFAGGHTEMVKKAATVAVSGKVDDRKEGLQLTVKGKVTNSGAGHLIPTGIPGIREMWLEVEVLGPRDQVLEQKRFAIGQRLATQDGTAALPWEAYRIVEDTRIEPQKSKEYIIRIPLPPQVSGSLNIRARLYDRLISESMSRRLNLPVQDPVLMTSAEVTVSVDTSRVRRP